MAAGVITQVEAIRVANSIASLMVSLAQVRDAAIVLNTDYVDNAVGAMLAAMPTVPLNADGTFGTADGSPVAGNTINPAIVLGQATPTSSYNYGAAFNVIQQALNLLNGVAVTTQATAPNLLEIFRP